MEEMEQRLKDKLQIYKGLKLTKETIEDMRKDICAFLDDWKEQYKKNLKVNITHNDGKVNININEV